MVDRDPTTNALFYQGTSNNKSCDIEKQHIDLSNCLEEEKRHNEVQGSKIIEVFKLDLEKIIYYK